MSRFWASTLSLLDGDMDGPLDRARVERVMDLMYRDDFWDIGLATIATWGRRP